MERMMHFHINGRDYDVEADPSMRLLDLIRDVIGLKGTKEGCSEGECGACTVILDGEAVTSCILLAGQAEGRDLITIEGVAVNDELTALQRNFVEVGAIQCGFCTPGLVLSAKALLDKNPHPTEADIRRAIAGNLCRCTGYQKIVAAIHKTAEEEAK